MVECKFCRKFDIEKGCTWGNDVGPDDFWDGCLHCEPKDLEELLKMAEEFHVWVLTYTRNGGFEFRALGVDITGCQSAYIAVLTAFREKKKLEKEMRSDVHS